MQIGADGGLLPAQDGRNLGGGAALIIEEVDGCPGMLGKGLDGLPYEGQVLPLFCGQGVPQLVGGAQTVVLQPVFAQVGGHPQQPGLFVLGRLQDRGRAEKLEQGVLEDLLGVALIVEVGISLHLNDRPSRISERWETGLKNRLFPRSRNCGKMISTKRQSGI